MAAGEGVQSASERRTARSLESWLHVFGWALVGVGGFAVGAYVAGQAVLALLKMGVQVSPAMPLGQLVLGVILYGSMLALLVGASRYRRHRFTRKEVGLGRVLTWRDIALSIPALVLYFLLTFLGLKLAGLVPGFDANQVQINDLGPLYGANIVSFFSRSSYSRHLSKKLFFVALSTVVCVEQDCHGGFPHLS